MSKIVYIIPGYGDKLHLNNTRFVSALFRKRNITPIPIKIKWKYRTITDYLSDFFAQVKCDDQSEIHLFGFSYGAMIAFLAAPVLRPKKLYLCSLSPFFREDLLKLTKRSELRSIGKKKKADFMSISFNAIAKSVKCNTMLFVGSGEMSSVINRSVVAKKTIKKAGLSLINHATHNLNDINYQKSLRLHL